VDGEDVFMMTRTGEWRSCQQSAPPCGTALWNQLQWNVSRFHWEAGKLVRKWTMNARWMPPPTDGSGWEPVFHPVLVGRYLYVPANGAMVTKFDRETGAAIELINPFETVDNTRYVAGPLTVNADGDVFYNALKLSPANPWSSDVTGAWLIRLGADGESRRVSFTKLIRNQPANCVLSFAAVNAPLPWPPSPNLTPPSAPCGAQRPGLNIAPAVAPDGTIYTVTRAHFNASYSFLVAVNPDMTLQWTASLRDRLQDGCGVLLPANGTPGGCAVGTRRGVDPTTNLLPAGFVLDQSTSSPAVAPDGAILYGAFTGYNHRRGHMMKFSAGGEFLTAYDFGWDNTPAIYPHDGTYSVIFKDNHYGVRSYCGSDTFCLRDEERYELVSLDANLKKEWGFLSTNTEACELQPDGSKQCVTHSDGFEWCVNMVAVDRDGVMFANSEDGNLYAINREGKLVGNLFLKVATGAAYTPLAIGPDGRIYTQNAGSLFVVGARP
jgi:outer membrane protein assembly factor BamB